MKYPRPTCKIRINRQLHEKVTSIFVVGPMGNVHIRINSRLSTRQRRTIAYSLFRQIKPWIKLFRHTSIMHGEELWWNFPRFEKPQAYVPPGKPVTDKSGFVGFQIRMLRLELGLSQTSLANQCFINRAHLSEIERGLCAVRESTMAKITDALALAQHRKPDKPTNGPLRGPKT